MQDFEITIGAFNAIATVISGVVIGLIGGFFIGKIVKVDL